MEGERDLTLQYFFLEFQIRRGYFQVGAINLSAAWWSKSELAAREAEIRIRDSQQTKLRMCGGMNCDLCSRGQVRRG